MRANITKSGTLEIIPESEAESYELTRWADIQREGGQTINGNINFLQYKGKSKESERLMWWGYLHTDRSIILKRFYTFKDILEAKQSPFVVMTAGPIEADDRETAQQVINNFLNQ